MCVCVVYENKEKRGHAFEREQVQWREEREGEMIQLYFYFNIFLKGYQGKHMLQKENPSLLEAACQHQKQNNKRTPNQHLQSCY